MMEEIRKQLQAMLDATENKEQITQLTTLSNLVDKAEEEHTTLQNEQKDLLKDYKELVKHTSFKPTGTETQEVPEQKELTFGDFLSNYKPNNKI